MGFFSIDLIVVAGGAFCAVAAGPVKERARGAALPRRSGT